MINMDIMISNHPIYEIQEEHEEREEDINTNRDLVFERLNTEYGDEDDGADYERIAKELNNYLEVSVALIFAFITLQLTITFQLNFSLVILPLVFLELRKIVINCLAIINSKSQNDPVSIKYSSGKNLFSSFGNLGFYSIFVLYFLKYLQHFIIAPVPLLASIIANLLMKRKVN